MDYCKAAFKGCVKGLFGGFLFCWSTILYDGFGIFDVDVAEVVVPILVGYFGSMRELTGGECRVDFCGGRVELVKDPELGERFVAASCWMPLGFE